MSQSITLEDVLNFLPSLSGSDILLVEKKCSEIKKSSPAYISTLAKQYLKQVENSLQNLISTDYHFTTKITSMINLAPDLTSAATTLSTFLQSNKIGKYDYHLHTVFSDLAFDLRGLKGGEFSTSLCAELLLSYFQNNRDLTVFDELFYKAGERRLVPLLAKLKETEIIDLLDFSIHTSRPKPLRLKMTYLPPIEETV